MPKRFNDGQLSAEIKRYLQMTGPSSAGEICQHFEISQPVFSRLAARSGPELLVAGKARSTRYALRREIPGVGFTAPVYEVLEGGESIHFATLHGIWPKGFYLETRKSGNNAPRGKPRGIRCILPLEGGGDPLASSGETRLRAGGEGDHCHPLPIPLPSREREWAATPLQAAGNHLVEKFFFDGLPYFFEDLRPSGFLGRLIPRRHPDLHAPEDVRLWSADHCLQYLVRFGANLIGSFIVGDAAFKLHLASIKNPPDLVSIDLRPIAYAKMAEDVLIFGPAGSSAGGEQPKFLATRGPEHMPVIVKFSPPVKDEISQRLADLLVCEHIAHGVLDKHGFVAAKSAILTGGGRTFLEIERFDRIGAAGRIGLISLGALAAQFTGIFGSWSETSMELARQKIISESIHTTICALELFGRLIANTDMHMANLSFFMKGTEIQGLAPAYDILPMMYAPQYAQLIDRPFEPPPPMPAHSVIWPRALSAAKDFWNQAASCAQISDGFKSIARSNAEKIAA